MHNEPQPGQAQENNTETDKDTSESEITTRTSSDHLKKPNVNTHTLSERYATGNLEGLLTDIKIMNGENGRWTVAEMQVALEKYLQDPKLLTAEDKKQLELLGRLAAKEDSFHDAADRFAQHKQRQSNARTYQEKVDSEGKDPFDLNLDPLTIRLTKSFEAEMAKINTKYSQEPVLDNYSKGVAQFKYDLALRRYNMSREGDISGYGELVKRGEAELERWADMGDPLGFASRRKERIEEYKSKIAAAENLPPFPDQETYWQQERRAEKVREISKASERSIGGTSDYKQRYNLLRFSPFPEDSKTFYDASVQPTLDSMENFYSEPLAQIQFRVRLAEAMRAGDPRLTTIDKFGDIQVSGKVKKALEVYEQSEKAGIPIDLPSQLFTIVEKKQIQRYIDSRAALPVAA